MKYQLFIALIALLARVQFAEKGLDIDLKNAETKRDDSVPQENTVPGKHVLEQQNEPKIPKEEKTAFEEKSANEKQNKNEIGADLSKVKDDSYERYKNVNSTSESSRVELKSGGLHQSKSKTIEKINPIRNEDDVNERVASSPESHSQLSESKAATESEQIARESDASEDFENKDEKTKQSPIKVHSLDNRRSHDIPMIDVKGRSVEKAVSHGDENGMTSDFRMIGLMPKLVSRQQYIQGEDGINLHQGPHSLTPTQLPLPDQYGIRTEYTESSRPIELRRTFQNFNPVQSYGQLSDIQVVHPRTMDHLDGIPSSNTYPYHPAEKKPNTFAKFGEAFQYPVQHVSHNNLNNLPPFIKTYDQLVQNFNPYLFMRHLR